MAEGEIIDDLEGKVLRISFPNQLFLTVDHNLSRPGKFAFEVSFIDQKADGESL